MPISPTLQIAFALVFVTCALLVLIDSMFQVFPDPDAETMRVRTALAQSVAGQAAATAQQRDARARTDAERDARPECGHPLAWGAAAGQHVGRAGGRAR